MLHANRGELNSSEKRTESGKTRVWEIKDWENPVLSANDRDDLKRVALHERKIKGGVGRGKFSAVS